MQVADGHICVARKEDCGPAEWAALQMASRHLQDTTKGPTEMPEWMTLDELRG